MSDLFDLDEITTKNARIKELEALIQKYQSSYYNGEAEISDAEFDKLWDELKELSPTSKIPGPAGSLREFLLYNLISYVTLIG